MGNILLGKPVAEKLENIIKEKVKSFRSLGIFPTLCVVKVGDSSEAEAYARSIEKFFLKVGINVDRKNFDKSISLKKFNEEINLIGEDRRFHGILVLRPLSEELEKKKAFQFVPPNKDIEGITYENLGKIVAGEECFYPCTSQAVIELLDFYNIPLEGREVVVVGRSISVGKPLSLLLINRNATVTICHSKTRDLLKYTKNAEILIVAVGKPSIITQDMVGENIVVVDVGTNMVDGKIVGDVDFERVKDKVKAITPVPGGIGVITTRVLALNLLRAVERNEIRV